MARFKEFYTESVIGMAAKAGLGRYAGRKLKDSFLRKLGLDNRTLGILTGGKYYKWKTGDQNKFKRDYDKFLKLNKNNPNSKDKTYDALKYLDKRGSIATKDNQFYKTGMSVNRFVQNLNLKSKAKGAFEFLKNTAASHGGNIMTILRAIK